MNVHEMTDEQLIERLLHHKRYHMNPYNLGDMGETGMLIDEMCVRLSGSKPIELRSVRHLWRLWRRLNIVVAYPLLLVIDIGICWTMGRRFKDVYRESVDKLRPVWRR